MKTTIIVIVVLCIGVFAWWTISPLFINKTVEDELPADVQALLTEESNNLPVPQETSAANDTVEDTPKQSTSGETSVPLEKPVIAENEGVLSPASQGPFTIVDTPGHGASGAVRVITTSDGENIVRYENYKGTNGPDLYVYLAKDLEATDFINLGRAKGNVGNINYSVPDDVDLSEYQYVMTWCKAFGVLFDYSEIK